MREHLAAGRPCPASPADQSHTPRTGLVQGGIIAMIRTPARFIVRPLFAALIFTGAIGALGVVLPATAGAYATIEGPPVFSTAPGLPDGRVYELVSPADKNGNEAGGSTGASNTGAKNHYGYASPDGDGGLYEGTGPMGVSPWGNSLWFVSTKNNGGAGWSTHALMPRELTNERLLQSKASVFYIDPSQDLSHALLEAGHLGPQANESCSGSMFLVGSDPLVAGVWVERPSPGLATVESCGEQGAAGAPVGGTPDFSTVYFTVPGTLLGEDAARSVHAVGGDAWGLYEDTEGVLREAGVLPDGSLSPFGAVPAASGHGRNVAGNEVSAEGSRLFFVSPDPASCEENGNGGENDCVSDPPELYMREDAQRSVLVSRDELLGEPGGVPVASPGGIVQMANLSNQPGSQAEGVAGGSFVFASVDGSRAFFQSTVPLTQAAVEDSPGAEAKTYEFDAATGSVVFLPGVRGEILAVDGDGSAMAFLSPEGGGQPARLSLWSAAAGGGGVVTPVVVLPEANPLVPETRLSADGSVLVFQTRERLSASFNSGGVEQIYRYDVAANSLGCVSCDPPGVTPRGHAELSILLTDEERGLVATTYEPTRVSLDERGISGDGGRIFLIRRILWCRRIRIRTRRKSSRTKAKSSRRVVMCMSGRTVSCISSRRGRVIVTRICWIPVKMVMMCFLLLRRAWWRVIRMVAMMFMMRVSHVRGMHRRRCLLRVKGRAVRGRRSTGPRSCLRRVSRVQGM